MTDKKKEIKVKQYQKSLIQKEDSNRGRKKQGNYKTVREQYGISKCLPISNYIKCKCIKFSHQKA